MPGEGVFSLDRSIHWRHIVGNEEEKKRQEAILELIVTEANYYQRLTVIHEVRMSCYASESSVNFIFRFSLVKVCKFWERKGARRYSKTWKSCC